MKEVLKGFESRLFLGLNPITSQRHIFVPPLNEEAITPQILNLVTDQFAYDHVGLEFRDPFGRWVQLPFEEIRTRISDHLAVNFRNTSIRFSDAARAMTRISVAVFQGLPVVTPLRRKLVDTMIEVSTNLGDGPRYFDENTRQWNFIQRKGRFLHESHFYLLRR